MKYVQVVVSNNSNITDVFYTYGVYDDNTSYLGVHRESTFEVSSDDLDGEKISSNDIKVGAKVLIPFGRSKNLKEGYVVQVLDEISGEIQFETLKYVEKVDQEISLNEEMIQTAIWMRNQYMSRYIECIKLFLPVGSKAKRRKTREVVDDYLGEEQNIAKLTDQQKIAYQEIEKAMERKEHQVFLLEGVTGSGKTEVYMQAVAKAISMEKNAIVVVPEVALTKQTIDRFIVRFGRDRVAVMHSKMTAGERYDQWQKIRRGQVDIVIGARSAVFAPIENIGVIIIDEEHESSYRSDMSPKYDTWEVAAKRAMFYGGIVVLGSGTPSVSSLYRAFNGQFKKLLLTERYNKNPMPEAFVVDMRKELLAGNKTVFSRLLYDQIRKSISEGGQVILFINRRGYSPYVFCRECGYKIECKVCKQPMNYHKKTGKVVCHYCGRSEFPPNVCPECGSSYIKFFGAGTEQIEEAAKKLFKDASVDRLDTDTGKTVKDINRILDNFNKGKTQILVGTGLVAKGMDNPNVKVVGIMAIDSIINYPDYRAGERAFQLIAQAGGRAGRGDEVGKVVIQTYEPDAYPVIYGGAHNVEGFYSREIVKRKLLGNPPFSRVVQVVIGDKDLSGKQAVIVAKRFLEKVSKVIGNDKILSIKNRKRESDFQRCILFKFEKEKADKFRTLVNEFKGELRDERNRCSFIVEFEPNNLWR